MSKEKIRPKNKLYSIIRKVRYSSAQEECSSLLYPTRVRK